MNRRVWLPVAWTALLLIGCNGVNQHLKVEDGESVDGGLNNVNGSISVGEQCEVGGDLSNVNGSIRVGAGSRVGGINNVNGRIMLANEVTVDGDVGTTNGRIEVGSNARVNGELRTTNGRIEVGRGTQVDGPVSTVNGRLRIVGAEVAAVSNNNGDMALLDGTRVKGDVRVRKSRGLNLGEPPEVLIGRDVVVEGKLHFEREVNLRIHESATVGEISGAEPEYFSDE